MQVVTYLQQSTFNINKSIRSILTNISSEMDPVIKCSVYLAAYE